MKKRYKTKGSVINQKDVQFVGEKLEEINKKHKKITPNLVVAEAEKKSSILHKYFEWDNDLAGEKYRLGQARQLICDVVEVVLIKGEEKEIRSFFHVKDLQKKDLYVSIEQAINTPSYLQQLIREAQGYINYLSNVLEILMTEMMKK